MKKEIGNRIQTARNEKGLTQNQLAEKINISAKFLSEIETGNKGMSFETLLSICDILDVSPNYLLNKDVKSNASPVLVDIVSKFPEDTIELTEKILHVVHDFLHNKKGK